MPDRRVNDYAGVLAFADRARLEEKLAALERESANQTVVAIFRSLGGESLEDYSVRLAQAWRVGQQGLDNGVVFLVFLDDRKMRLEVGYGLEATLTDAVAASILRDAVAPHFREGRLADGIEAGLDAVAAAIAGTPAAPLVRIRPRCDTFPAYVGNPGRCLGENPGPALGIGALVFLLVLGYGVTRRRRSLTGGRRGWVVDDAGDAWSSDRSWSSSGSSWSSSGSSVSSSSESFSGGGGDFGGGGASGDW